MRFHRISERIHHTGGQVARRRRTCHGANRYAPTFGQTRRDGAICRLHHHSLSHLLRTRMCCCLCVCVCVRGSGLSSSLSKPPEHQGGRPFFDSRKNACHKKTHSLLGSLAPPSASLHPCHLPGSQGNQSESVRHFGRCERWWCICVGSMGC